MNISIKQGIATLQLPIVAWMLAAFALSGCATFSHDGGFDSVAIEAHARLGKDVRWARTAEERSKSQDQVSELMGHVLSADDAVQIALLNSPMLQASFEELGISEADLVQSGRLPNPGFTYRHAGAAGRYDIEEYVSFNLMSLFTAPYAHEIEKRRFVEAQNAAIIAVAALADQTRRAYFAAVAARESLRYMGQVKTAAEAGAELARRMVTAGNWSVLDQAREQRFDTDAAQSWVLAELSDSSARQTLMRLMGLSGEQPAPRIAESLPELPRALEALPDVEQEILQSRIDLRLMRLRIDELAHSLRLVNASRFVDVLQAGPVRVLQGAEAQPDERGYEISLVVPIFDGGAPRVKKAQAIYAQAVDRFAQAAINARAQIQLAYAAYRATYDMAVRQRDEVMPTAKQIASQNLLRYNASLISIFDLLTGARGQVASVTDYIHSLRDFWLAKSALDAAGLGNYSP